MRRLHRPITLAALLTLAPSAVAVDYSRIDRSIAREPAYQSRAPKYCLVVYGPEARTRVWLVLDGDVLYADRNGDGDLTGADERFPEKHVPKILPRDGAGPFSLEVKDEPGRDGRETYYEIWCRPPKGQGFHQRTVGRLAFADRPQEAPVVHFGGPLTLTVLDWNKLSPSPRLLARGEDNLVSILVGTPVFGSKHEAFATVRESFRELAGPDRFPVAEVELPGKEPGAKPIVTRAAVRH